MALTDRPAVGLECKLYYNTATHASPTWVEVTKAINVSYSITKAETDQSSRESTWRDRRSTLKTLDVTFTYRKVQGTDAVFTALAAAYVASTIYEYAVLDAAVTETGAQGVRFFGELMTLNNTQDLEASEEIEFTLMPTYFSESGSKVNPDWYIVGS